jgi:hypothetical protein
LHGLAQALAEFDLFTHPAQATKQARLQSKFTLQFNRILFDFVCCIPQSSHQSTVQTFGCASVSMVTKKTPSKAKQLGNSRLTRWPIYTVLLLREDGSRFMGVGWIEIMRFSSNSS